jgi:tripartite-type tricarboxylate transporter receptor subunit TctC
MLHPIGRRQALLALPALAGLAAPRLARAAAAWPGDQPVQVVVPFPPGGGVDQMARLILPYVQEALRGAGGQGGNFVVENRPGAGSQIGLEYVFNSKPDGYTLCAVTSPAITTIAMERPVRYEVARFGYVANIADDPGGLWVAPESRFRTLDDLIRAAREKPETLSLGTTGIGSDDHLMQLEIQAVAQGVRFNHVPYAGSAPLQTALLGGHLDVGCFNMSEGVSNLRAGKLRALAQGGEARWSATPEVPTLRESGISVTGGAQRGIVAPPGLPPEVMARMVEAFGKALANPRFQADAARVDMPLKPLLGEDYRRAIMAQTSRWQELWQRSPWREG